jgi:KDO2-lipid IV(A) lauroyltransferase
LRFRLGVIQENLGRAFPQDLSKQKTLVQAHYRHLGNLILEILLLFGPFRKFVLNSVQIENGDYLLNARKRGKGSIIVGGHLGNWEVMAAAGGVLVQVDPMIVTKHLKPEWLHQAIQRGRLTCDVKGTYEPRTYKDVVRHLKGNGVVGIIVDQYVGPPVGVRVKFFGTPVGTAQWVATLAKRTGAEVISMINYRKPDGTFVVEVGPPIEWQTHENPRVELALNTQNYSNTIEKVIYRYPEQWLWTHRRFKGDLSPLDPAEWAHPRFRN